MPVADPLAWAFSQAGIQAAREFLSAGQRIEGMIGLRLSRLEAVRSRARKVTRALDTAAVMSGYRGDPVGDAACRLAEMEDELLQDYHKLLEKQKEIQQVIDEIPDDYQRMVLELRYLQGISMLGIARRLNYDERTIQRIHHKALIQTAMRLASRGMMGEEDGGRENN